MRFSISLPLGVARDLDQIVEGRGFANRSQAVASMVQDQMLSYRSELGSEVMMGLLTEQGYELTQNQQEADVLVVNTCGFIDSARQESPHSTGRTSTRPGTFSHVRSHSWTRGRCGAA